ncbi:MAG: class I SAM-dependent methyltransferase, partial [Gemmatimonadaceae bacterium]
MRSAGADIASAAMDLYRGLPLTERLLIRVREGTAPLRTLAERVPTSGTIADVGCGHGLLTSMLALGSPARSVIGIDPDPRKIELAARSAGRLPNATFRVGHIEDLSPELDGTLDAIVVADVLYLLPAERWKGFLDVCHRLLKPNGKLLIKEAAGDGSWKHLKCAAQEWMSIKVLKRTHDSGAIGFKPRQYVEGLLRARAFRLAETVDLSAGYTTPHVLFMADAIADRSLAQSDAPPQHAEAGAGGSLSEKIHDLFAIVLCLGLFGVAMILGGLHEIGDFGVESDFYGAYGPQSDKLRDGERYTYRFHPPGFMLLLAGLTKLLGVGTFTAAKIISAVSAALICALSYATFKSLFNAPVALAATLLLAMVLVPYSYLASNDLPATAAMLSAIWVALRRSPRWLVRCLIAGALAGAAYLIRTNGIVVVAGLGIGLLFLEPGEPRFRRRAAGAALLAAGFLLVAGPWLLFNWTTHGSPFASTHHLQSAAHFHHPGGDQWGANSMSMASQFSSLSEVVLADPVRIAKTYVKDMLLFYPAQLMQQALKFPAVLFVGTGLVLLIPVMTRRRVMYLIPLALAYAITGLVGFYARYYVVLFPLLFLAVAFFAFHDGVRDAFARFTVRKQTLSWGFCAAVALLLAYQSYDAVSHKLASEP